MEKDNYFSLIAHKGILHLSYKNSIMALKVTSDFIVDTIEVESFLNYEQAVKLKEILEFIIPKIKHNPIIELTKEKQDEN